MTTERNASADDQPQQRAFYNKPASCKSGLKKENYGGRRYLPYVFTEQGIAMLSSILRSEADAQKGRTP